MNKYNIQLKSFKHFPAFSEETLAFTTKLTINGKVVGHADNNGHGGSTNASLLSDCGIKIDYTELSDLVDDLAFKALKEKEDKQIAKKVQKQLAKDIVFTVKGEKYAGRFFIYKNANTTPELARKAREAIARTADADKILNDVPLSEAMEVMVK